MSLDVHIREQLSSAVSEGRAAAAVEGRSDAKIETLAAVLQSPQKESLDKNVASMRSQNLSEAVARVPRGIFIGNRVSSNREPLTKDAARKRTGVKVLAGTTRLREDLRKDVAQNRIRLREKEPIQQVQERLRYSTATDGNSPAHNPPKISHRKVSCCCGNTCNRIAALAVAIAGIVCAILGGVFHAPALVATGVVVTLVSLPIFIVLQIAHFRAIHLN